ncbi:uncharacterized protein M6B38_315030 [Iris pallida]|uniref:Uncharacterized protein n=1 Tax=Iris pallida TaxID=29817 RepID=A0AAX6HEG0_IRIPA|nr:uncharacterized protein M6B38_315030 [Iris pallida]
MTGLAAGSGQSLFVFFSFSFFHFWIWGVPMLVRKTGLVNATDTDTRVRTRLIL